MSTKISTKHHYFHERCAKGNVLSLTVFLFFVVNLFSLLNTYTPKDVFVSTVPFNPEFWMSENGTTSAPPAPLLELPENITTVFINIGSNLDPILPPLDMEDSALVIAFEPIVGCRIKPHKSLKVVHAAVAATSGLSSMFIYNKNGESSSLAKPSESRFWNDKPNRGDGVMHFVPVLTIKQILNAIPSNIAIPFLKTDMQGYDFAAIEAAQESLFERKVDIIYAETFFHKKASYVGVKNDFCQEWFPHMKKMGYDLHYVNLPRRRRLDGTNATEYCASASSSDWVEGMQEGNALWKRRGGGDPDRYVFQTLK